MEKPRLYLKEITEHWLLFLVSNLLYDIHSGNHSILSTLITRFIKSSVTILAHARAGEALNVHSTNHLLKDNEKQDPCLFALNCAEKRDSNVAEDFCVMASECL